MNALFNSSVRLINSKLIDAFFCQNSIFLNYHSHWISILPVQDQDFKRLDSCEASVLCRGPHLSSKVSKEGPLPIKTRSILLFWLSKLSFSAKRLLLELNRSQSFPDYIYIFSLPFIYNFKMICCAMKSMWVHLIFTEYLYETIRIESVFSGHFYMQILQFIMCWSTRSTWICVLEIVISFLEAEYFILREVAVGGICACCLLTLSTFRCVIFN